MANEESIALKSLRRRKAKEDLAIVSPQDAEVWSGRIAAHLATWLAQGAPVQKVATFAALSGEPNLRSLHLLLPEQEFFYPLTHSDKQLSFHLVRDPTTMVSGRYGIMEPDPSLHPQIPLAQIEVTLCPGLAFAGDGTRLGQGKGFYDRVLSGLNAGVPKVGVGFARQQHLSLPREPHDQRMTHLVSEDGIHPVNTHPEAAS